MFNNDNNGMVMPVAPTGYMGSAPYGNDTFGNGWWIILLFILFGYGNNGWGNGAFNGNGGAGNIYPWMNQAEVVNNGFRDQNLQNGISDLQMQMANGHSNIIANDTANAFATQNAINQGFYNTTLTANNNAFAMQNAMNQGFNSLQSQFANCCCENRLANADVKYTIATENCQDRYEAAQNTRDIIENSNRNNQVIMDKLCQLELDAKNDTIAQLRSQLTTLNTNAMVGAAVSQVVANNEAQTAQLIADNAAQTRLLNPQAVPAYVVPNPNVGGCCNYQPCCA